jgi:hypothetical protein
MSPKQIVPRLADKGVYIEKRAYRVLHEAGQMVHRGRAKAPEKGKCRPTWQTGRTRFGSDITCRVDGSARSLHYLYLMLDLYSRKVGSVRGGVNAAVVRAAGCKHARRPMGRSWCCIADNGGPMKG